MPSFFGVLRSDGHDDDDDGAIPYMEGPRDGWILPRRRSAVEIGALRSAPHSDVALEGLVRYRDMNIRGVYEFPLPGA